ncbi:OPT super [Extremus antarcticus]|uniref:OPT super n=1 Tax=Extremus antarcticus TaxID=702011 RepID=A0AAJ0DEL0_9PEZI|nr:OPT super [Extremus antarcticus]
MKYGLTDYDIEHMPPAMIASPQRDKNFDGNGTGRNFGAELGKVVVDGEEIDAGRKLVRDQWNSELYKPLDDVRLAEDLVLENNRLPGFWKGLDNANTLRSNGIRTLIFAGANLDQCVLAGLLDAFHEGFDILLLSDGAATTSPEFATECVQWNCELGWGFVLSSEELQRGVNRMRES